MTAFQTDSKSEKFYYEGYTLDSAMDYITVFCESAMVQLYTMCKYAGMEGWPALKGTYILMKELVEDAFNETE